MTAFSWEGGVKIYGVIFPCLFLFYISCRRGWGGGGCLKQTSILAICNISIKTHPPKKYYVS